MSERLKALRDASVKPPITGYRREEKPGLRKAINERKFWRAEFKRQSRER